MLHCDLAIYTVKPCQHVVFDEALFNLPLVKCSFHASLLQLSSDLSSPDIIDMEQSYPELDVSCSPFISFHALTFWLDLDCDLPLGFSLSDCDQLKHGYLQDINVAPVVHCLIF